MKKPYSLLSILFFLSLNHYCQVLTQTFSFSGASQTFVVPSCVNTITMEVWGAQGGANWTSNTNFGGYSKGTFSVTPGSTLNIYVGQQPNGTTGGFNGGGNGESLGQGGGGASDVRQGGNALINRIIVAGGGGGAGYWSSLHVVGGVGGGLVGGDGYRNTTTDAGGQGGTQTGSGLGTCVTFNNSSVSGGLGFGGSPTSCGCEGYGGGGGYYGGAGSGNCRGGGGGSGYLLSSATNTAFASGVNIGNGKVVFSYSTNGAGVIASSNSSYICSGSTATLSGSNVLSYTWTPGGSNSSSIAVSPTSNTSYTIQGTNSLGCISSSVISLTVNSTVPVLTVANTASSSGGICPTQTVVLTASGALTHNWSGGAIPVTNGVVFSPTSAVSYTVSGVNGCGTTTAVTSVSVHPFPTVNASTSASTLCAGSSVTLTATGNATNYVWSGGAGGITNGVGFNPPLTATYTVIGTSALSCTAFATMPVTVYPTPFNVPTANPALVCIGGSSTLSASGAVNYTWTSGTQTVYTSDFIVTPIVGTTTYTITKANSSCFNTQTLSVVTNSLPTIFAIVSPTVVCALSAATLAVGGAQTYTWTAPGPPSYTFTGPGPVVSPIVSSTYSVAASDGTCINTTTVYLAANPNPTITVSANTPSICEGGSVTLNATGGLTYNWLTSGGATLTGQTIAHSPTIATAYNVTGNNSFGCTSGASQVVLVHPKPTIVVNTNKIMVCDGGSAILTASGTANTYSWDANANSVLTPTALVNPTALVSSAITYTVEGTETTNGCKNTQTVSVNVFIPILTISGNTNTCAGGLINLSSTGGVLGSHSWNTGSGTPLTGVGISTPLNAASVFTLTANSVTTQPIPLTCPATQTIALGIYFNPTITAVPSRTSICIKESVDISAAGGVSYNWSNNMTGSSITITPTGGTAVNFTVTGTDANGCSSTGTVQVKISGCNSINELGNANSGLSIYPNPNDGRFIIQSNSDIQLNLVNELGQLVRVIQLTAANKHEVNITDLAKGIYFVSGEKDSIQIYQKIVVTK